MFFFCLMSDHHLPMSFSGRILVVIILTVASTNRCGQQPPQSCFLSFLITISLVLKNCSTTTLLRDAAVESGNLYSSRSVRYNLYAKHVFEKETRHYSTFETEHARFSLMLLLENKFYCFALIFR